MSFSNDYSYLIRIVTNSGRLVLHCTCAGVLTYFSPLDVRINGLQRRRQQSPSIRGSLSLLIYCIQNTQDWCLLSTYLLSTI